MSDSDNGQVRRHNATGLPSGSATEFAPGEFAARLADWHRLHGRHDLPWQRDMTPYRVWVSEIMLQQTQVATVIPYYQRFVSAFPHIAALADAQLDDVLHLWSGLGYYARGRNLHRAAQLVCERHAGQFPSDFDDVLALPGIGRSTAGAILALTQGARHPILDGNVKRVLARFFAIPGWPGTRAVADELWERADRLTPRQSAGREVLAGYTQAIMDLGATVCTRSKPRCSKCPVRTGCRAFAAGEQKSYPGKRPRRAQRRLRSVRLLLARTSDGVLLERRPPAGIWGGLWSLPELGANEMATDWCRRVLGGGVGEEKTLPVLRHVFTHFDLDITPLVVHVERAREGVFDDSRYLWYNSASPPNVGLPAPVALLLTRIATMPGEPGIRLHDPGVQSAE